MNKEKLNSEVYTLHRYIDDEGKPDFNRIFSEGESKFWPQRHIGPDLLRILDNQPDIVRNHKFVTSHLGKCQKCKDEYGHNNNGHSGQGNLPF